MFRFTFSLSNYINRFAILQVKGQVINHVKSFTQILTIKKVLIWFLDACFKTSHPWLGKSFIQFGIGATLAPKDKTADWRHVSRKSQAKLHSSPTAITKMDYLVQEIGEKESPQNLKFFNLLKNVDRLGIYKWRNYYQQNISKNFNLFVFIFTHSDQRTGELVSAY